MTPLALLIGVLSACALVGAVPALVNALKPRLQELLHLEPERVERLERMQFFLAWVAGMPLAGLLVDSWNYYHVLFAGCAGISFTVAFLGVTETPRWVGLISFALGLATSFLVVATFRLIPEAVQASSFAGAFNLAFIATCLGSFTPETVFVRLERWLGIRRSLLLLGLGALIPAVLLLVALARDVPEAAANAAAVASDRSFYTDRRFWLVAVMLLLDYPIESAIDIWSEPFLGELGYSQRTGRMLVGFWLAFLLARLAMWRLLGPRDEIWLLSLCAFTSAILLGNLVGAYGASAGGVGFWLVGACYGPLLPGFLGLLVEVCPQAPGLAIGSVLALAGLHDALAQPLMRRGAQGRSVRAAMRIPLVMTLLMLAPLVILGLVRNH